MQDLTKISLEGKLMVRFTDNVLNLWYEGLPKDIHFSLSINENNPDINLHITREVNNPGNKPKYEIFLIARDICEDIGNNFGRYILYKSLSEFDVSILNSEVVPKFISHDKMNEHEFYFSIEEQLTQAASNFLKYRGKKEMRIKSNVGDELEKLTSDELALIELYNNSPDLSEMNIEAIESGIVLTDTNVFSVINYYGKLYVPKNNISIMELITGFCGNKLTRQLFYRIKKGIVIVRNASSFDEVKHLYSRIRIIKRNPA